jgi:hypothetical protein
LTPQSLQLHLHSSQIGLKWIQFFQLIQFELNFLRSKARNGLWVHYISGSNTWIFACEGSPKSRNIGGIIIFCPLSSWSCMCSRISHIKLRKGCPNRNPLPLYSLFSRNFRYSVWNQLKFCNHIWLWELLIALTKIWNRKKVHYGRYLVLSIEKWIPCEC